MTTAIILSAPQGWGKTRQAEALKREFGCTSVVDDWHPRKHLTPGALHLTNMHPGDLEDWGFDVQEIERRGWPCARDCGHAVHRMPAPQIGAALPQLQAWLAALLIAFALGASHLLGPDDHSFENDQAQELEAAQRQAAAEAAYIRRAQAVCGPNTGWVELPDGTRVCTTKRGKRTGVLLAGANP